jgi:hypothetical protein
MTIIWTNIIAAAMYHRGSNAREQADRQACGGDEFAEKCQVSQRERQRQAFVADGNRKSVR